MYHFFSSYRAKKRKRQHRKTLSRQGQIGLLSFFLLSCSSFSSITSNETSTEYSIEPNVEIHQELKKKLSIINTKVPHNYALLINTSTEDRHKNNVSLSYQVLLENGYKYEDVLILDTSAEPTAVFPLTDFLTRESLLKTLTWFNVNANEKDTLFIYITGHGLKHFLPLNSFEFLAKDVLVKNISTINTKVKMIFIDVCYWDSLSEYKLKKSVVMAVTTNNNTSSGVSYPRLFWNHFRHHKGSSLFEAFNEAKINDTATKHKKNFPSLYYSIPPFLNLKGDKVI